MKNQDSNSDNRDSQASGGDAGVPRRRFLARTAQAAAAGALGGWVPVFRIGPNSAMAACAVPPNFPAGITLYQQAFQNWSREIAVDDVWTCAPQTPADVVTIVNWAHNNGYKARPRGMMHNWSPLTIPPGSACPGNVILVDTTQHLTAVSVNTGSTPKTVTAQTGITMENLLTVLEQSNLGVTATPAPGDLTLGGVLAIDAHGTAVPANGETPLSGKTYGSLSNLVRSLTAVVWDAGSNQYALQTFQRSDPGCAALLTHLGRAFITEVTLQVGANQRLRCQSWFNIPATEMFATQGSSGRTFASYINSAGRVEAIWYPFTDNPWLKVWSVAPNKPFFSRQVNSPYNYPISDNLPQSIIDLAGQLISGNASLTPTFGQTQYTITASGLVTTFSYDIWGWSKNLMLYIKPTTLRVTANGYAVLVNRSNIQRAVNEFVTYYKARVAAYQAQGLYPMNGPVEIRVTGLDNPADMVGISGAPSPQLSALRPRPDHPEWDVAVWFDILTLGGTQHANEFYREVEQWMLSNYSGSYATVRPEWSKGWAYTNTAAWADSTMLGTTIPNLYRAGQPTGDNWDTAQATLNQYDPYHVYSSPLLDALLP
jgi:FAD/FMN-containing dehydrogenase